MASVKAVLVIGDDPEIVDYQSRKIADRNRREGFACAAFDLKHQRYAEVEENLAQASLFSSREFLWLQHAEALSSAEIENLERRLKEGSTKPLLISVCEKAARLNRWASLQKVEGVKVFALESTGEKFLQFCEKEIVRLAARQGKKLKREVPRLLLEKTNGSFLAAVHELEKLCLYYEDSEVITPEMVEKYAATTTSIKLFDFIDAFLQRSLKLAAMRLDDLLLAGEKPEAIFYVLLSIYTDFVTVIVADKSGKRMSEIARLAGLRQWQVEKYRRLARGGKWEEYADIYWKLLDFDRKIKSGQVRRLDAGLRKLLIETF